MWVAIVAFVIIAVASSTKESRAAGQVMIKRWEKPALILAIVGWALILSSLLPKGWLP